MYRLFTITKKYRYPLLIVAMVASLALLIVIMNRYKLPQISAAFGKKNIVPTLIIGSGPAGLSAGLYTARDKIYTVILSGHQKGGQLGDVRQIENWPGKEKKSGSAIIHDLMNQITQFGAVIITDSATSIDFNSWPFAVETEKGHRLYALTLIIATGRIPKRLNVPGVETYWGKGIGTCTICDAPFHKNQIVGVVGGGDTAVDHALRLSEYAEKVYMIIRDSQLDASETVQDSVKNTKNITILHNTEVEKVEGDEKTITSVTVKNRQTGQINQLPLKGLYFAIGYHPNSELVKGILKLDQEGFIVMPNRTQKTPIQGVFIAGDVIDKQYGKAGVATGSGVKAGIDAIEFLQDIGFTNPIKQQLEPFYFKPSAEPQVEIPLITKLDEFNQILNKHDIVAVDFYADYCYACKTLEPYVQELAQKHPKIKFIKVELNKSKPIVKQYKITAVPSFLIFQKSKALGNPAPITNRQILENLLKSANGTRF